jgi:hypothetical protein
MKMHHLATQVPGRNLSALKEDTHELLKEALVYCAYMDKLPKSLSCGGLAFWGSLILFIIWLDSIYVSILAPFLCPLMLLNLTLYISMQIEHLTGECRAVAETYKTQKDLDRKDYFWALMKSRTALKAELLFVKEKLHTPWPFLFNRCQKEVYGLFEEVDDEMHADAKVV